MRKAIFTSLIVLLAKAGFDANGKVTDKAKALKTIAAAGKAERQFHLTITAATIQFRSELGKGNASADSLEDVPELK